MANVTHEFDITSRIVILVIMLLGAIFSAIAGIIFIYLFYKYFIHKNRVFNNEAYSVFGFYKAVETVNAIFTAIYLVISCIYYRIDENKMYGNLPLFWTSAFHSITSISRLIAIFVLGLDRICLILFSSRMDWGKRQLSILIGPALIIVSTLFLFVYKISPNIPEIEEFFCPGFLCLTQYGYPGVYFDLKTIFEAGNFIVGIVLLVLTQNNRCSQRQLYTSNSADNLILLILALTFGLDLIPHVVEIVYRRVTSILLHVRLGPYSVMLTALESIFCGLACIKILSTKKIIVIHSAVKSIKTIY